MSGLLGAINISSNGLSVQRAKMNAVADNIANAETTKTTDGGPYKRKRVLVKEVREQEKFSSVLKKAGGRLSRTHAGHRPGGMQPARSEVEISGVEAQSIEDPASTFKLIYDPSHPQANEDGYVQMPDVEIINEMVDMMAATRAYEANTVAISSAKKMVKNALDI